MHDDVYISGHSENNINASCMTISGGRTKQLDIFCRVTGFTSDFLSFIVVELIQFFHGAIQLPGNAMVVLQVNVAPPKTFFTDRLWLPFLSPNQQCQTSKRQVQSFTTLNSLMAYKNLTVSINQCMHFTECFSQTGKQCN